MRIKYLLASLLLLFLLASDGCGFPQRPNVWTNYSGGLQPPPQAASALAYAGGSTVVLYDTAGGWGVKDTWEYDSLAHVWTQIDTGVNRPPQRALHAMAYAGDRTVVMFGGSITAGSLVGDDTWEYNAATHSWTEGALSGVRPPARIDHCLAYAGNGKVVLFGGCNNTISWFGDTWVYNASTHSWTEFNTTGVKPAARLSFAMSYIGNNSVVLFGGSGIGGPLNDTWRYDVINHTWEEIIVSGAPPSARDSHLGAYAGGSRMIVFGGVEGGSSIFLNETWLFELSPSSGSWDRCVQNGVQPSPRDRHMLAYGGSLNVVMFGGNRSGLLEDGTWEYYFGN